MIFFDFISDEVNADDNEMNVVGRTWSHYVHRIAEGFANDLELFDHVSPWKLKLAYACG